MVRETAGFKMAEEFAQLQEMISFRKVAFLRAYFDFELLRVSFVSVFLEFRVFLVPLLRISYKNEVYLPLLRTLIL